MSTRTLLNLVLLVIVAALAAITALEPGKAPPPEHSPITPLAAEAVTTLRVERPDEPPMVLERRGDRWRMSSPRELPAHPVRSELLSAAAEAESLRRIAEPGDLVKYALDRPRARLTLNDHTLIFGDIDPLHQRRYLLADDTLHLVADNVYPLINRGWDHFVDPALLPAEGRIDAIRLADGTTLRRGEAGWSVSPDTEGRSADAAQRLHDAWRFGRALEVSAHSDDGAEGDAVELTLADGSTLRFLILAREPSLLLARPDLGLRYQMADGGESLLRLDTADEGSR